MARAGVSGASTRRIHLYPAFAAVKGAGSLVIWGNPEAVLTCLVLFTEAPSPLLVGRHPLVKPSAGSSAAPAPGHRHDALCALDGSAARVGAPGGSSAPRLRSARGGV